MSIVETDSEDTGDLLLYMQEESTSSRYEQDLEYFLVHLYPGGEIVGSFERGYI